VFCVCFYVALVFIAPQITRGAGGRHSRHVAKSESQNSTTPVKTHASPPRPLRRRNQVKIWSDYVVNRTRDLTVQMRTAVLSIDLKSATDDLAMRRAIPTESGSAEVASEMTQAAHPASPEPDAVLDESTPDAVDKRHDDEPLEAHASPFRTWTDDTGRYRIVARVVEVQNGTVRLRKQDDRSVSIPRSRLSQADRQYIDRWLEAKR
jgi:hypothetical protein